MNFDFENYTGSLKYKDIVFTFVFNRKELQLTPSAESCFDVESLFYERLANGAYVDTGRPVYIEESYLEGWCNETKNKIVFIPSKTCIGQLNNTLIVNIMTYVVFSSNAKPLFDRIDFSGAEINGIYPARQAIDQLYSDENGVLSFKTKNYDQTSTEKQTFCYKQKNVDINFSITRKFKWNNNEVRIELSPIMSFYFEATNDYEFINSLVYYAKYFLQYLNYRRNINLSDISLFITDNAKNTFCAKLFTCDNKEEIEEECVNKGKFIMQSQICSYEGKILDGLISNNLYTRHIPKTYSDGKSLDAAKFIMICTAFEAEFHKMYKNVKIKNKKRIEAEENARKKLNELKEQSKGKLKKIYAHLIKTVDYTSLEEKLIYAYESLETILHIFAKHLYGMNNHAFSHTDMAKRLSTMRNKLAHGSLDIEFNLATYIDIGFLERMVYAMQLKSLGISDNNIQKALNTLFSCHIAL